MYNKSDVHKTIVLFSACIVNYDDSFGRAFVIGIYLNHLCFSFFGNRRGFGSEERGNARWFQRRHCARRYGLQVKLGNPDRIGGTYGQSTCFLITWVFIGDDWATPNARSPISDSDCPSLYKKCSSGVHSLSRKIKALVSWILRDYWMIT